MAAKKNAAKRTSKPGRRGDAVTAPWDWPKIHPAASAGYRTSPGVAVAVRFLERWEELEAEVLR